MDLRPEGWTGGGPWALILDGPRSGAWNMALDSALLQRRVEGLGGPSLRLYWWSRPTLSLGRFQDAGDVDLEACREAGVDVVRRPTGGRAVLHDCEVTYSVVASVRDGLPRGVAASYGVLCAALVEVYRRLGVAAELVRGTRGDRSSACYLQTTRADLSLGAAKLSGSAQVWRDSVCLQHGSVVISRDVALEARLLRLDDRDAERLGAKAATLSDALAGPVGRETVVNAFRGAFADVLGIGWIEKRIDEAVELQAEADMSQVVVLANDDDASASR